MFEDYDSTADGGKKGSRRILMALLGVYVFCVLPNVGYVLDLLSMTPLGRFMIHAFIVVLVSSLSIPLLRHSDAFLLEGFLITFSILASAGCMIFDTSIKNYLSQWAGYYSDSPPPAESLYLVGDRVEVGRGRFSLQLPPGWQLSALPSGHNFLQRDQAKELSAEIRITCIDPNIKPITDLVSATVSQLGAQRDSQVGHRCYRLNAETSCLIKADNSPKRWVLMKLWRDRGAQLTVLFKNNDLLLEREVDSIFLSLRAEASNHEVAACTIPVAWI
ncbi:hypothetical protein [Halioxenophilus aromaticivorans]|uniref:hypothetical protein n=1 Tax=Halioxenophilus aromaticivorans TaxID=1306992 RepID=UPI0031EDC31A